MPLSGILSHYLLLLATFCYPASARVMGTAGQKKRPEKKMKGGKELTETEADSGYDTNNFILQMRRHHCSVITKL